MRRILVPTDGSDCSLRAVDYVIARRGALADGAQVHLLNVQIALSGDVGQFVGGEQIASFHRSESAKSLAAAQARLDAAQVPYTVHAEVGHAAEVIARTADKLDCDHIVMGTHGRSALADLLLGSTTIRVVHLAKMPVVLVK